MSMLEIVSRDIEEGSEMIPKVGNENSMTRPELLQFGTRN